MRPPWTEQGSRDAWLAEVVRRGERIRSRRRMTATAIVAVALLGPAIVATSLSAGRDGSRPLRVAAGGPASVAAGAGGELPSVMGGTDAGAGEVPPAPAERTAPLELQYLLTTTTAVAARASGGSGSPPPDARVVDDPVVRPTPATGPPSGSTGGTSSSSANSGPRAVPSNTAPPQQPALAACPAADVRVTVSTEKSAYAPGETVRFSSTLENRSATACLVSGRAFFSVENGAGRTVSSFAYTMEYMLPVRAEPGQAFTNRGTWDQQDCSGPACVQAAAGTYVVVAGWTEGGPYTGRGSFQIGA